MYSEARKHRSVQGKSRDNDYLHYQHGNEADQAQRL
jgi:hypothetical protein